MELMGCQMPFIARLDGQLGATGLTSHQLRETTSGWMFWGLRELGLRTGVLQRLLFLNYILLRAHF